MWRLAKLMACNEHATSIKQIRMYDWPAQAWSEKTCSLEGLLFSIWVRLYLSTKHVFKLETPVPFQSRIKGTVRTCWQINKYKTQMCGPLAAGRRKRWNGGTSHSDPVTASTQASFLSLRLICARRMPWLRWAIQGSHSKARSLLSLGSWLVNGPSPTTKTGPVDFVLVFVLFFSKKNIKRQGDFPVEFCQSLWTHLARMVTLSRTVPAMWDNNLFALAPASWYPLRLHSCHLRFCGSHPWLCRSCGSAAVMSAELLEEKTLVFPDICCLMPLENSMLRADACRCKYVGHHSSTGLVFQHKQQTLRISTRLLWLKSFPLVLTIDGSPCQWVRYHLMDMSRWLRNFAEILLLNGS